MVGYGKAVASVAFRCGMIVVLSPETRVDVTHGGHEGSGSGVRGEGVKLLVAVPNVRRSNYYFPADEPRRNFLVLTVTSSR